jgi:hypothetical protein
MANLICSDADSEETIHNTHESLASAVMYWECLETKAARHRRRALDLQVQPSIHSAESAVANGAHPEELQDAMARACQAQLRLDSKMHVREARLTVDMRQPANPPQRGVRHDCIPIVHNNRGTTAPMSNLQEGLAPNGRASTGSLVNESGLQADQHGAPAGDLYDCVVRMVHSALLKHQDGDPEKSALAKAGVKVAQPTKYSGSSNLEEFKMFVAGILRWLGLYNLLGPTSEQTQVEYVGTCLKSEAQEWFYRNVEHFD